MSVSIDVAELLYRKGTIRDLSVAVDIRKGVIAFPRVQAVLPGDMTLRAATTANGDAAKPAANGEFSLNGPKLRETLKWLEIDTSGVPAARLQTLSAHGKIASAADKVQVSEATFALDGVSATGSGTLALGVPIAATVQVQIDRFDLDGYLPEPATGLAAVLPAAAPAVVAAPAATSVPADPAAPSFGLKAKIASLVYRGQPLKGVEADVVVQGRLLKLNGLKVGDLLGAKLDLRGQVSDFGTAPRFDVTFNTTLPDADRLLDYAALPKFLNGKIGAASASGGVVGDGRCAGAAQRRRHHAGRHRPRHRQPGAGREIPLRLRRLRPQDGGREPAGVGRHRPEPDRRRGDLGRRQLQGQCRSRDLRGQSPGVGDGDVGQDRRDAGRPAEHHGEPENSRYARLRQVAGRRRPAARLRVRPALRRRQRHRRRGRRRSPSRARPRARPSTCRPCARSTPR